jgi:hypothetical protein
MTAYVIDTPGLPEGYVPPSASMNPDATVAPTLGGLRPAWLTDDGQWREQLSAMPEDEVTWLAGHWDMAGGARPDFDMSWVTTVAVPGDGWGIWPLVIAALAFATLVMVVVAVIASPL